MLCNTPAPATLTIPPCAMTLHCCHKPRPLLPQHLDKVTQLLRGPRFAIRRRISSCFLVTTPLMLALLALMVVAVSVVLAVVLVLVLALTLALLGSTAVSLPLAAAFELLKAVDLHAAGGARRWGSL